MNGALVIFSSPANPALVRAVACRNGLPIYYSE